DQERRTPLHAAAYIGDVAILELLILSGANVNAKDTVWLTPLHRAAASRHEVREERGNSSGKGGKKGLPALLQLLWGLGNGGSSGGKNLPWEKNPRVGNPTGGNPTAGNPTAGKSQSGEMVNLLLNKGASPSTCDKKDRQPLHWAAFLG
ncbi:ANR52 phosphatase, partial [Emberiza fucata]|nr:ANR52 phosphatase [Emberiza fucata]